MAILWSDLKLAVRVLKRAPGFSTAVIVALALGIGPNTAIFSIVYSTLLAPLPFPDPDQLVMVWSKVRGNRDGTSPAEYLDWKRQATSFQYLEPFWPRYFNLATPGEPERVRARQISPEGHRMLGETVWLGRDFRVGEDQPGKNQVALLSHKAATTSSTASSLYAAVSGFRDARGFQIWNRAADGSARGHGRRDIRRNHLSVERNNPSSAQ